MDELIVTFIDAQYSSEHQHEIYQSLKILNDFEYPDVYSDFIEIISMESYKSSDQLIDNFNQALMNKLDDVLKQHHIVITNESTIVQRNGLLNVLYTLQTLEDYTAIISILESERTPEEQLAAIVEEYSNMDETEVLSIIQEFNPVTLTLLKSYIEENQKLSTDEVYQSLMPRLKQFYKLYGKDTVGYALIASDVKLGYDLPIYLDLLDNDFEPTALNILSLILMTVESNDSPLKVFNKYSDKMIKDIRHIAAIESDIIQKLNTIDEHMKASS